MNELAVSARGLTKRFGGFTAVDQVDLAVKTGTIHALIGPNGAGKTTVFNLLTRFLEPDQGSISFFGKSATRLRAEQIANRGVVRSFQISAVFLGLTALQNVRVPLQRATGTYYQFWRSGRMLRQLDEQAMALLESVQLERWAHVRAAELPYGRKRALEFAMTLALQPRLLLLDEPMAGLGGEDIERVSALIRTFAKERTILMVEHNLSVVAALSDVITVLQRGRILAEGPYAEIANDPRVIEAYLGTEVAA